MLKHALLAAGAIVGRSAGAAFAVGRHTKAALLRAHPTAGLRRRLRARGTITPHGCEAPSFSAGSGPEACACVRTRTSAVDHPRRRRDVARRRRHRRARTARKRRPLTAANEPEEFFASDFESMAPEEKLKDPLVLLGLGSIFLPFIMILGFQATGARPRPVTSRRGRVGDGRVTPTPSPRRRRRPVAPSPSRPAAAGVI